MDTSGYTVREYCERDLPGILDLWEKHSGWGRPGVEEFKKWMKTPFGDCYVYVAENEAGRILGQIVFTPNELYVEGIKFSALKVSAPIIADELRGKSLTDSNSLLFLLLSKGYESMIYKGYSWIYTFPAFGWLRLIQNLHQYGSNLWKTEILPCYEVAENNEEVQLFTMEIMEDFTPDSQSIWEKFKSYNICSAYFTRDLPWLKYKWGECLKVELVSIKTGKTEGYAVIKRESGLLEDLIVLEMNALPAALIQLSKFFSDITRKSGEKYPPVFRFMPNALIRAYLGNLKTRTVNYSLPFAISSFTGYDAATLLDLEKWYVFPND